MLSNWHENDLEKTLRKSHIEFHPHPDKTVRSGRGNDRWHSIRIRTEHVTILLYKTDQHDDGVLPLLK